MQSQIEKDAKKDFEMERDEKALLEACDSDDGDPDIEFEGILFSILIDSTFWRLSRFLEGFLMEHKEMKNSSEFKLPIDYICSIRDNYRK